MKKKSGPSVVPRIRKEDGNHLVLWYRTEAVRADVTMNFIKAGNVDEDIYGIVLPFRELQGLEDSLIERGFPVEKLMKEGRLYVFASEELLPHLNGDISKIHFALSMLNAKAKSKGKNLRLIGRIAPVLFEQGDLKGAMSIEEVADAGLENSSLLCLYDGRRTDKTPEHFMKSIDDLHTVVIYENPDGTVKKTSNKN